MLMDDLEERLLSQIEELTIEGDNLEINFELRNISEEQYIFRSYGLISQIVALSRVIEMLDPENSDYSLRVQQCEAALANYEAVILKK